MSQQMRQTLKSKCN